MVIWYTQMEIETAAENFGYGHGFCGHALQNLQSRTNQNDTEWLTADAVVSILDGGRVNIAGLTSLVKHGFLAVDPGGKTPKFSARSVAALAALPVIPEPSALLLRGGPLSLTDTGREYGLDLKGNIASVLEGHSRFPKMETLDQVSELVIVPKGTRLVVAHLLVHEWGQDAYGCRTAKQYSPICETVGSWLRADTESRGGTVSRIGP